MARYIDYDPCDECHEKGDDYYQDEDGDWMLRCYDCPLWERREDVDRLVMPPADGSTIKVDGERRDDAEVRGC